ncbi:MAG: molybdate ABC transporter substrate-binding protein [Rhizobiales bacterium]|nr:molybdate ABC transporter substrate-binding protein [Hyphomicrobiales bacterium]
MKNLIGLVGIAFAAVILLSQARTADAAEIKMLSAIAMQQLMEDLGPKFERATGHKLTITFATLGPALKRVQDGETYDVAILPRPGIESLVKDGKAVANTTTAIARTGIGVAVRKGAIKPDISSPEAFKRTLLAAKSITYSNPAFGGLSGIHVVKVFERLGIAEEMKSKTVLLSKAGLAGVFVANGEAEIVVQPLQELMVVAGIDIVGPLPGDLQDTVVFPAAIMAGAKDTEASQALINFLRTPAATAVIKSMGMEPG